MIPIVHGLQAKYEEKMLFTYLDIDDPNTTSFKRTLNYQVQPNFFLLDANGKVIKQWLGAISEAELVNAFESALK